ncbi:hypothetical protein QBC35DRAFT_392559 [Podospora australis]|uniref:F-box domain-containing protein n=1 Tax=Podospora australis TaxID=1536484 RepID=A0AAN6WLC7_9PEZI|nr:hypothetical protein QBC35DRAFT_392559 [Podospora australis]
MAGLGSLPGEILLHILSFLEPPELTTLQLVSRGFRNIARDNSFWRLRCLQESSFLHALDRRRRLLAEGKELAAASGNLDGNDSESNDDDLSRVALRAIAPASVPLRDSRESKEKERVRIMANFDPCFPREDVSWYDEYIRRQGPIAVNWLQMAYDDRITSSPDGTEEKTEADFVEARGVALYYPNSEQGEEVFAVSPLDDGSVCLWDVGGTRGRKGAIVSRSRPGILLVDGPRADNSRSKRVDSGVTECVSVDSQRHRAFFAVQSHLIEVDLRTLSVIHCELFTWSIMALSAAHPAVPLTVGTSSGIHLHDYRSRKLPSNDVVETIDGFDRMGAEEFYKRGLRYIFDDQPLPPYAPLHQPCPLSILHLQRPGQEEDLSDDIYVAGRFSNILHYDRRQFPSIKGSIHSGASLCSMASLPYPFSAVDSELRRKGQLSLEQVANSKNGAGRTLIACGEYNTKGSLEIYGLSSDQSAYVLPGGLQNSTFKNRQTASQSKLLSVVNHGSCIAVSDGSGCIKWFERDGFTEVRRHRIGHSERTQGPSIFASMPGSDDLARKLLPTHPPGQPGTGSANNNDLLFWTGEKLGLVSYSSRPGFTAEEFEKQEARSPEAAARAVNEQAYSEGMRKALERQADDARWVRNLGGGSPRRRWAW